MLEEEITSEVRTFPAGKYYVGDPCYVIGDHHHDTDWEDLGISTGWFGCDPDIPHPNFDDGLFEFNGHKCFAYHTAYGDGLYTFGRMTFGVDAGLLSVIPVEAIKEDKLSGMTLGEVIEFKIPFKVWYENGVFYFGHVEIDTN